MHEQTPLFLRPRVIISAPQKKRENEPEHFFQEGFEPSITQKLVATVNRREDAGNRTDERSGIFGDGGGTAK